MNAIPVVDATQSTARTVRYAERLVRCVGGLALFGAGIALIVKADLGLAPWDVFHQGVSEHTGLSLGLVLILTAVAVLLLWIPLHQRPGVGTVLNALEIGVALDLVERLIPDPGERLVVRLACLAAGLVIIGIGSGLYIGARLGAGPRDGLMIGLSERGVSVRLARTFVEISVLMIGIVLGGSIGIGTLAFTLGIGPLVQFFLPRLDVAPRVTPAST